MKEPKSADLSSIALLFQTAVSDHQAGNLNKAEEGYRRVLALDDQRADACHMLGIIQNQRGNPGEAIALIRRALAIQEDALYLANLGLVLRESGSLAEAETAFRRVLELNPGDAETHYNLAGLLKETARLPEAETAYRHALVMKSDYVEALVNLALLLHETGRLPEAETTYRRALAIRPDFLNTYNNLGLLLQETKRIPEAESIYRRALALNPDYASVNYNLGLLLQESRRFPEAEAVFRHVIAVHPSHVEAHLSLGHLLFNSSRTTEAETYLRHALVLQPDLAVAHNSLGLLFYKTRQVIEAEACFRSALAIAPDFVEALNNLGLLLHDVKRFAEAEAAYRQALAIGSDYANSYHNLGLLLTDMNRWQEAEEVYRHAIDLCPDYSDTQKVLGMLLLAQERYEEGWPLYECRHVLDPRALDIIDHEPPVFPFPQWHGESLEGKSLLIWQEQSFGDYIQIARYAPLLKARGVSRLVMACDPALVPLLETVDGVDAIITEFSVVTPYDYWVSSMSLPANCGTTTETIPATIPYLHALPDRINDWKGRLPETGLKVGLVWKGNPDHPSDITRSLPGLATLAPLWNIPGVKFISLQKGAGEDEAAHAPDNQPILALGSELADFADTAAVVAQLDLLICVDTAVAHLAGAIGKPCWILLPALRTDWRWLRDRTDTPWYPGVTRLFRQADAEDWQDTVQEVATALALLVESENAKQPSVDNTAVANHAAVLSSIHPYQLGMAAQNAGRFKEAEEAYRRVSPDDEKYADALHLLGLLRIREGDHEAAETFIRQALAVREASVFLGNLGSLLQLNHRVFDAEVAYRRALALRPDYANTHYNLGKLLHDAGRMTEAEAEYRAALKLEPDFAQVKNNLSMLLLTLGKYAQAWPLFESRKDPRGKMSANTRLPGFPFPEWKGESLVGKSLLVWPEQGQGDYIQFVRYAPLLKQRGLTRLTLVCDGALKSLFETVAGVDAVVSDVTEITLHDYWSFHLSLPLHFATTIDSIPANLPYLHASPERMALWADRIPKGAGRKVGLVWKGNAQHPHDASRSLPGLKTLAPLGGIAGVHFINLQKDAVDTVLQDGEAPILSLGNDVIDFADTAAIIAQLDLVICVDTAVAHLAGALGQPCWVLLPAEHTDWRWLRDRVDTPWYPERMRLFRQTTPDDWNDTVEDVVAALAAWVAQ